jgi:hypothetical protein
MSNTKKHDSEAAEGRRWSSEAASESLASAGGGR